MTTSNFRNDTFNFGPKIKALRNEKGYTVRQVALKADLSASYWSQVENKKREIPTTNTLDKMAIGLGVPNDEIYKMAGISKNTKKQDAMDLAEALDNHEYMTYQGKPIDPEDLELIKRILRNK